MKERALLAALIVGSMLLILGAAWIAQGNDFFLYRFFAPKYEDTRREVFEHSKAFRQGAVQELENMRFEYVSADAKHKDALASIILHRAADYDDAILPSDLRDFIRDLKTTSEAKP